jgi:amidase
MMSSSSFQSAFVPHDLEAPLAGAEKGALAGLTFAVKDMYDIAGYRTGGGNPDWLAAQAPATRTASVIIKLLDAGATAIGKTVCDEFFYSVTGANAHYGTPENPMAPGRLPGGSSSGSAAATAARACNFSLGSDTGGSIRVPAALCGILGIRPTHGRVDLAGAMAMAPSFDVAGWFASEPAVFRRVGDVLFGGTSSSPRLAKLVILEDAFSEADPPVAECAVAVIDASGKSLPERAYGQVARNGLSTWVEVLRVLQAREMWSIYGEFIQRHRPRLGPGIRERVELASRVSRQEAEAASRDRRRLRQEVLDMVPHGTVLALPTTPCIAPLANSTEEDLNRFRARVMRLTCIASLCGLPQVTIPAGLAAGCPVGLSFIGWQGADEALLQLPECLTMTLGLTLRPREPS